jgi:hypothetical protein
MSFRLITTILLILRQSAQTRCRSESSVVVLDLATSKQLSRRSSYQRLCNRTKYSWASKKSATKETERHREKGATYSSVISAHSVAQSRGRYSVIDPGEVLDPIGLSMSQSSSSRTSTKWYLVAWVFRLGSNRFLCRTGTPARQTGNGQQCPSYMRKTANLSQLRLHSIWC